MFVFEKFNVGNWLFLFVGVFVVGGGGDGREGVGGGPARSRERVRRTVDGEEKGVDQGGDGDDGEETEDEFESGEVDGARRSWERWRRSVKDGGCAFHYKREKEKKERERENKKGKVNFQVGLDLESKICVMWGGEVFLWISSSPIIDTQIFGVFLFF